MIMLAISKVKSTDEDMYKLTIENCHGKDEADFMLYVAGKDDCKSFRITKSGPLINPVH